MKQNAGIMSLGEFGEFSGGGAFFLAKGVSPRFKEEITELDAALSQKAGCAYKRTDFFPKPGTDDAAPALERLDALKRGESHSRTDEQLMRAVLEAVDIYRSVRPDISGSIEKNLTVNLIFLYDKILGDMGTSGERRLVCSGKTGYKEFLFCLAAAKLGVSVLLLAPGELPDIPRKLLDKAEIFTIGGFGSTDIPKFAPRTKKVPFFQRNTKRSAPALPQPRNGERRELSYEETASLASSVVMITVCGPDGKPVGEGSGVAISKDGYILTNCHVVQQGRAFSVMLENDGKIYRTTQVIKYHTGFDLAVIRINRELTPLKICSGGELRRGQRVVAIGSPMGLFNTVSNGIISGFREIDGVDMIQFTAPISSGSSGGALLNMYGELIGISTGDITGGQNLNLAVSYKDILLFASSFCKTL